MIDLRKTVGTAGTFDPERIRSLLSQGAIENVANLEKAIFCLEYVAQLQEEGLDFIFKGGSAVQTLLSHRWTRLSIDVDICTDSSKEELETILEKIRRKFDEKAFSYSQREREISGSVPFYLYRIETPAITEESRTILLDAIGIRPKVATQQVPLKTFFYDSPEKVTAPTTGALLGDKLSTIGSTSIGRPLNDSRNGLEYAKHLFDIGILQETDFNVKQCQAAYMEAIDLQSKVRNRMYTLSECFIDMLFTCQVASLSQQLGEQAIKTLASPRIGRAASEFRILQDGLRRFRPFLVQKISYSWDDLRSNAARTALLVKIFSSNISDEKAREIFFAEAPTTKEEILTLIEQVKKIPEERRWFILLDEIANFPKILKTWHSFFFLDELL